MAPALILPFTDATPDPDMPGLRDSASSIFH
jgi:hypothetical protein